MCGGFGLILLEKLATGCVRLFLADTYLVLYMYMLSRRIFGLFPWFMSAYSFLDWI